MNEGVIIRGLGGLYTVLDADGREHVLRAMKKLRRVCAPAVGDRVSFLPGEGEEHGWIEEILPRRSFCERPPVANITLLALTIAPAPAPDLLLIDRLLVTARRQNIRAILIVNKCDLDPSLCNEIKTEYAGAGAPVYPLSAKTGEGLDELRRILCGETACLAGQSGVGKSTLIGLLLGRELKTGDISRISRGRHTTRCAELLSGEGFRVLDTPGFSLLENERMEPLELKESYPEFLPYEGKCRFQPCYHQSEPGCAALAAAREGKIDSRRLERYHILLAQVKQAWKERYD